MRTPSNPNPERKNPPRGSLDGIRVLDLSRVLAGPLCTQMLADHGADVVKIEPPAGDDTRWLGPPFEASGDAAYFSAVNRGKRAIGLDLARAEGKAVLLHLLEQADVLVENFIPGTMKRWGLDFEADLSARFPRLIYCSISGFGADGPLGALPGYDAVLQAYGGLMSINGYPDRGPLRVGVPIVDIVAANLAFSGILLALQDRHRTGLGQFVDISLLDSVTSLLVPHSANWAMTGMQPQRTGAAHPAVAPYQTFDTPAGEFFIGTGNDRQFRSLMTVLGRPELADDPNFSSNPARIAHVGELGTLIAALVANRDLDELARELNKAGVPSSPVKTIGEALTDEQVLHRELFIDDGEYRGVGIPIKLSRSKPRQPIAPAAKGADTDTILRDLGLLDTDGLGSEAISGDPHKSPVDEHDACVATIS